MERPDARIVARKLHHHVSIRTDKVHIPSHRVVLSYDTAPVPSTIALRQNLHIAAVNVPWMSCVQVIVQVDADRAVGSVIVDLPIIRE